MSGHLTAKTYSLFKATKPLSPQIEELHGFSSTPSFGGEIEIMALQMDGNGEYAPVGYMGDTDNPGMRDFLVALEEEGYDVTKRVEGLPIGLTNDNGEVITFENYAAFVERADRSYSGSAENLKVFGDSIDRFTASLSQFATDQDIKLSPFDFDTFCKPEAFEGKHAPSERFGEGGLLDFYDHEHPLNELIDRHTSSSHFSIGYKDPEHLWRQVKVMTKLVPALYAAFSSSPPTMEVTLEGEKTILPKPTALSLQEDGANITFDDQLLVPRSRLWTLADPERTGINGKIAELCFDPQSNLKDMITVIIDQDTILHGKEQSHKSFAEIAGDARAAAGTSQYMQHVSTLWYDIRIDLLRLEARMAGSSPWISKAMGSLMTTMMMDDDALCDVEAVIAKSDIDPATLLDARDKVGVHGLQTSFGPSGQTLQSLLIDVCETLKPHMSAVALEYLEPLEYVLDRGLSNSEFLASIEEEVQGDFSAFLNIDPTTLKPFVQMHEEGKLDYILNTTKTRESYVGYDGHKEEPQPAWS